MDAPDAPVPGPAGPDTPAPEPAGPPSAAPAPEAGVPDAEAPEAGVSEAGFFEVPPAATQPSAVRAPGEDPADAWSLHAAWAAPLRRRPVPIALLALAVLTALTWRIGARPDLPAFLWLGLAGTFLGVVDATLRRLPEPLTLPSYAAGVTLLGAAASFTDDGGARFGRAILGMAALGAFFGVQWLLLPEGTLGFGDVTLAGLLGMHLGWLGWRAWVLGVTATLAIALVVSLALLATRRAGRKSQIPYGPFLLAGTLAAVLVHG
ncbi:A24 family peptidase [Actinomadura litoris]|uniref:A24 family peptidase n=1 Tax=Actinomadura litoris TaxID=2678616 RepID=UPI0028AE89FF|nr:A24 family peptidase [Actinomadura litoris]